MTHLKTHMVHTLTGSGWMAAILVVLALISTVPPLATAAPRVLVRNTDGDAVAVITERGNLGLAGELHTSVSPMPTPSAGAEWVLRDSSGNVKALVKRDGEDEGDMYLAGTLSENQTSIPEQTPVPIFVSRDAEGNIVAKIDTSGNLTLAKECTDQTRQAIAVANGDFEDWTQALPSHWTCSAGALTKESGGPFHFDGSNFARIVDGGGESAALKHSGENTTHLDPGSTYRVTYALRVTGWDSGDSPQAAVQFLDADDTAYESILRVTTTPTDDHWHRFSWEFCRARQFYMVCRSNGATLDIDDVRMEEVPHAEPTLGQDRWWWGTGFELGNAGGWTSTGGYEVVSGGIMPTLYATENPLTHTTEAQDTYRGFYAIKFNDKGDEIASSSPWNNLNPSRTYRLTFHYKILCPSGYSTNDTLVLGYETASAQTVSTSIQAASWTSNEWRSCDLAFSGEGEISPFARYDDTAGNGGTIFLVDELELREIDTVEFPFGVVCESDLGCLSLTLPNGVYTEIPPSIVMGDWRHLYVATGFSTVLAVPPTTNYIDAGSPYEVSYYSRSATSTIGEAYAENGDAFDSDAAVNSRGAHWRKNYCGVFSAIKLDHDPNPATILGFIHGENKNEVYSEGGNDYYYVNNVVQGVSYTQPDDFSGTVDGAYQDFWDGYHGIVSLRTSEYVSQTDWGTRFDEPGYTSDEGPIIWPSNGFVDSSGAHIGEGTRHPAALADGDYLYLTFFDCSFGSQSGRGPGIKMARAPKSSGGVPGSWYYLFQNGFSEAALPANFSKNSPDYSARGGRGDVLHPEMFWGVARFTIAKLSDGLGYIGVEPVYVGWESEPNGMMCSLRYSSNLTDWSPRIWLQDTYADGSANYRFHAASFLSADGDSTSVVDPEGFYVVGAHQGTQFGRLWVSLYR